MFALCFYGSDYLYKIILKPLIALDEFNRKKIIYTGLTEAFFSYIKISVFFAFIMIYPFICLQIYKFIRPGLQQTELAIIRSLFILSPALFYLGSAFMFIIVMPNAWIFFLSFESADVGMPLVLEAKISEYLDLVIQLTLAFGLAFQMPIAMIILCMMNLISSVAMAAKRRFAIVIIFIIAAIFTPPDILSQFALAIPLILLYETSIILCKFIEKKE